MLPIGCDLLVGLSTAEMVYAPINISPAAQRQMTLAHQAQTVWQSCSANLISLF
ncbi:MAG TPA: hypothetical protein V6D19_21330 [Stenomitos sp.]